MTRSDEPLFEPRIADWLEDDPYAAPDQALDVVLAAFPSIKQRRAWRVPWRVPEMPNSLKLATIAVAAVLAIGGAIWTLGRGSGTGVGGPSPSPASPAASPAPSDSASPGASIPAMTEEFTSPTFGYSLRYPAGWKATATTGAGPLPSQEADIFEPASGGGRFRALSVAVPDGVVVDDWISRYLTMSDVADCSAPRDTLEPVTINGQAGRLRGFCGNPPSPEIEATIVVADRAYLFTLFQFPPEGTASEVEARAFFDAFAATITLNPQDAKDSPSPS
jgi:hypothetical protein